MEHHVRKKTKIVMAVLMVLTGCASNQPDRMYDGEHPLADTAVLSALDDISHASVCTVATVQKVDEKTTSRGIFPGWVRVLPGPHSFVIHCSYDFSMVGLVINFKRVRLTFTVEDMKPKHVYVARYSKYAEAVEVAVEDLGENPSYVIPRKGADHKVRAEF